jgi:hypothetical protein
MSASSLQPSNISATASTNPALRPRMKSDDVNQISFVEHFDCENHSVSDRSSAPQ